MSEQNKSHSSATAAIVQEVISAVTEYRRPAEWIYEALGHSQLEYVKPSDGDEGYFWNSSNDEAMYFQKLGAGKPSQKGGESPYLRYKLGLRVRDARNTGLTVTAAIDRIAQKTGLDHEMLLKHWDRLPNGIKKLKANKFGLTFAEAFDQLQGQLSGGDRATSAAFSVIRYGVAYDDGDLWDETNVVDAEDEINIGWWGFGQSFKPNPMHRSGEEGYLLASELYIQEQLALLADPTLSPKKAARIARSKVAKSSAKSYPQLEEKDLLEKLRRHRKKYEGRENELLFFGFDSR